jgi:heme/copper-type cytochrome/quinol oxidase subunit 3
MSGVTRSMEATSGGAAARVERARRTLPNGWWGALLFVATEAALFGSVIASYFYLRLKAAQWPPAGVPQPHVALPVALTIALVATSVPLVGAARAAGRGHAGAAFRLLAVAALVQAAYLGVQIHELAGDFHKFDARGTAYGSAYFTTLILHHAHVAIGLLLEVWIMARLLSGLTNYRVVGVRVIALYWHFVNLTAIAVTLTVISPAL